MAEADERFVHRLEAFSDVVIGFSLAQLGATLVIPAHPQSLLASPGWFFAFLWTFALVCSMWWNHNRIFRVPFHPTPVSLIANFALLASIVLLVYCAQVVAHSRSATDDLFATRWYFAMLGATYVFTAWLFQAAHGWVRGTAVNGISGCFQLFVVALMLLVPNGAVALTAMGCAVPVGFALGGVFGRRFRTAAAAT